MKKRLRKKLRKGEFKELGFELQFDYTGETFDTFLNDLIGAVESLEMYIGGGGRPSLSYFVYCFRKSVSPEQRQALADWLMSRPDVANVVAGELRDAWYGWDKE